MNITSKEFPNRIFATKEELFKELKDNKSSLVSLKKSETKQADASFYIETSQDKKEAITKAELVATEPNSNLLVKAVINTTNLLDSHGDVHIDNIWKKSINDNKFFLHLQEHQRGFDKVISDTSIGSVLNTTFKKLGFDFEGKTQALVFETEIEKKRNPFMYDQYLNGWVKQHSVGMRYVTLYLCIDSEADWNKEEKEYWDKYYPMVANKDLADEKGYFWAVTEAKIIEGSAVVMGSNYCTPTQTVETKEAVMPDTLEVIEPTFVTQAIKRRNI
jgi:hypothetical protein